MPDFADRAGEIADWDQVKLLTVAVDRLNRWHKPGLLCIGDAAHAMSPIGGVGVNLAVQDAVAAANILAEPLRSGAVTDAVLQSVQDRRTFPTRATQRMQLFMQNNVISAVLSDTDELDPPLLLRLLGPLSAAAPPAGAAARPRLPARAHPHAGARSLGGVIPGRRAAREPGIQTQASGV